MFSGQYAKVQTPARPGETATFASVWEGCAVTSESTALDRSQSIWKAFEKVVQRQPDRAYLGSRVEPSGELGNAFVWATYRQVYEQAIVVGSFLRQVCDIQSFPMEEYPQARETRVCGIYMRNCPEWLVTAHACNAFDIVVVPIYDSLNAVSIQHIVRQINMTTIVTSSDKLPNLRGLSQLKHIILADTYNGTAPAGVEVISFSEVLEKSDTAILPSPTIDVGRPCTFCYTSGTTNMPKGVILTHRNVLAASLGCLEGPFSASASPHNGFTPEDVHFSFLPLAHVFERLVCEAMTIMGAQIGFFSGSIPALVDDAKLLQPTLFSTVPRVLCGIDAKIMDGVAAKNSVAQSIFNMALQSKVDRLRESRVSFKHFFWDNIAFRSIKGLLGDRLRLLISGGSPLPPATHERVEALFGVPIVEGFGMSETFGPAMVSHCLDGVHGHIGGPAIGVQFKLISVPDMEYHTTDDPPRGELCLRGESVSPGYVHLKTEKTMDTEGWLHTGDIAELGRGNCVRIIDRKKNIFKLSQGEYVSPETLEAVYSKAHIIDQIFVYGQPSKNYPVAVVVPNAVSAEAWSHSTHGVVSADLESICGDPAFIRFVLKEIELLHQKSDLKGYERIRNVHMTTQAFSLENNMITPTMKLVRHRIARFYASEINGLYG
ncbi:MAG: uncharacterized protein KVP18_003051 [Porospora cf. gigantea A]|uniref:uncharacterized protein n=1 Tax=Porospora cf. gigantea A TaxID=2853593 RepID=UPI00355982AE|nr:MAG: hypothetical protein KVP18_003051 [Porospora cf. gigantea A]